jgi:hypothetical protein
LGISAPLCRVRADTGAHAPSLRLLLLLLLLLQEVAEKALYETVHFNLPRVNPNISAFTAWLREVRWKRERFRHLKTLVVHYGALEACPLVSADPPLRSPIDWHGQAGHLPDKPGQLLKEMRGYRGTLRHLILDAEGETFLLPIGLENLNWDELTTATYAARRFSHTGVTQNAGRKPPSVSPPRTSPPSTPVTR